MNDNQAIIKNLLLDPYFWLGQIGLGLTIVFGLALLVTVNKLKIRPTPYYYTVPLFIVVVTASFLFGRPFIEPDKLLLTNEGYLFRFFVGVLFAAGYRFTIRRVGQTAGTVFAGFSLVNRLAIGGCIAIIAAMGFIGFRLAFYRANNLMQQYIETDGQRYVVPDGVIRELRRLQDSQRRDAKTISDLRAELRESKLSNIQFQERSIQEIQSLRVLVLSLKVQIQKQSVQLQLQP